MRRAAILAGACGLALLVACGNGSESPPAATTPDVYRTRGIVERLPQPDGPDKAIYIRHAAIPEYRDDTGAVVGMGTMTMPFPLAKGVTLDGLDPGDPVAFTFAVTWKPRSGYAITELRELPAGTVIRFDAPEAGHDVAP